MTTSLGEWMTAEELPAIQGRLTKKWEVRDRHGGVLGHVQWYGAWRQYAFFPFGDPVFNKGCLDALALFLEQQMTERNIDRAKRCTYPGCPEPQDARVEHFMHMTRMSVWRAHPHDGTVT